MLFIIISLSILAVIDTTPTQKELWKTISEIRKYESRMKNAEVDNQLAYSSKLAFDVLKALDNPKSLALSGEDNSSGCACKDYNCGCCVHLEVEEIRLNDTVCANFSYLPKDYGVSVTLTVDKRTIFNKTISVRNPPAICAGVPYLKEYAELCVKFEDLSVSKKSFSGCVYVLAKLMKVQLEKLKVGCFKMPIGNEVVSPEITTYNKYIQQMERVKKSSGRY